MQPQRELRRRSFSFVDRKAADEARLLAAETDIETVAVMQVPEETKDLVCLTCGRPDISYHCRTGHEGQMEMHETPILPMVVAQHNEAFTLYNKIFSDRDDDEEESVASTSSIEMLSEEEPLGDDDGVCE